MTLLFIFNKGYSQCPNNGIEAVRNGDFELGYLPYQTENKSVHTFTEGGPFDFKSDLNFGGDTSHIEIEWCNWAFGQQYAVARAENYVCSYDLFFNQPYWAILYNNSNQFKDHTPKKSGKGFCLLVDVYQTDTTRNTVVWEQKINIIENQTYWFSAWSALYGLGTPAELKFFIYPIKDGVIDSNNIDSLSPSILAEVPAYKWRQSRGIWNPNESYSEVIIKAEVLSKNGGQTGLDFLLDDISFSTSNRNYNGYVNQGPTKLNPCIDSTNYNISLRNGNDSTIHLNSKSIKWNKSENGNLSQLSAFENDSTVDFTEDGKYIFTIEDGDFCFTDSVEIVSNYSVNFNSKQLCLGSKDTLKVEAYNKQVMNQIKWNVGGTIFTQDSIIINSSNEIVVFSENQTNFECSVIDTFEVVYPSIYPSDTLMLCAENNFAYTSKDENHSISTSDFGGLMYDFMDTIFLSPTENANTNLFAQTFSTDIVDVFNYLNPNEYTKIIQPWASSYLDVTDNILITEFSIKSTETGSDHIRFSGSNYNYTVKFEGIADSLIKIKTNLFLPSGSYSLYTKKAKYGRNVNTDSDVVLDGIINPGNWGDIFLDDIEVHKVSNFCESTQIPKFYKEECARLTQFTDTIKNHNLCDNNFFILSLKDDNGSYLSWDNKSITWFYEGLVITNFENKRSVEFDLLGEYKFFVRDTTTNAKISGLVNVNCSLVDLNELQSAQTISYFPNPTSGLITFSSNVEYIEVFSNDGKKLLEFHHKDQLNLNHLPNGLYFLKVDGLPIKVLVSK